MRKLTVLLLAGALLVITGGTSVAGGKHFAILECFVTGGPARFIIGAFDHSFDELPPECAELNRCAPCAAELTRRGLILVEEHQESSGLQMIFSSRKGVLRDD